MERKEDEVCQADVLHEGAQDGRRGALLRRGGPSDGDQRLRHLGHEGGMEDVREDLPVKQRNKQRRLDSRVFDHNAFMQKPDNQLASGVAKRRAGGGYHKPGSNFK